MQRALSWLPIVVVLAVAAESAVGFFRFAGGLPRAPDPGIADTEAIVVLTGGSGRIEAGLDVLAAVPGARLFVSGVHASADIARLAAETRPDSELASERIDVGRTAANTRGNALETARWIEENGFQRLTLVTAAYHMPRAEVEFRRAMPDVALARYPIFPSNVRLDAWWRYWGTTRLLIGEYLKLRFARLRP